MSDDGRTPVGTGLIAGLILGVVGTQLGAVLVGEPSLPAVAYGAGGGLVCGALAGQLVTANRDQPRMGVRIVGGGAVLGLGIGGLVGLLAAVGHGRSIVGGLGLGLAVGAGVGLVLGGLLFHRHRGS